MRQSSERRYTVVGAVIDLVGDTYSVRNRLKQLGARFVPDSRLWRLPHSNEVLVALHDLGFKPLQPPNRGQPLLQDVLAAELSQEKRAQVLPFTDAGSSEASTLCTLSVAQLCGLVTQSLERGLPRLFWIVGELTSVNPSRGHTWLELAEAGELPETGDGQESAQLGSEKVPEAARRRPSVQGVVWSGAMSRILARQSQLAGAVSELPLQVGLRVRLRGNLSFRAEGSRLLLVVDDIDVSFTQGQLALQRERTLAELRRRGLLDRNKRLPLPSFPFRVALITANQSRARNDFLHELERAGLAFRVVLFDCRMQGDETKVDVVVALDRIAERLAKDPGCFDVVVVTRGGGSRMDLHWFDDFAIARAIATCPLPVLTAIGHHEDTSIADVVAARAEKTPTAAAQWLVTVCLLSFEGANNHLRRVSARALRVFERERTRLKEFTARLEQAAMRRLVRERERLGHWERMLALALGSLEKVLKRGYALVWSADRTRVLTAVDLITGQPESIWLEVRHRNKDDESATDKVFIPGRMDFARMDNGPDSLGQSPGG